MTMTSSSQSPIIVIGTGIAGLACAHALEQAGQSVVLLEARNRIGGRMHSITHQHAVFDLGASWIHGIEGNPIWELVRGQGIKTTVYNYQNISYSDANGQLFSQALQAQFEQLIEQVTQKLNQNSSISMNEINAQQMLQQILREKQIADRIDQNELKNYLYQYFQRMANDPYATELEQLCANFQQFEGYFAGDEVIFPQGYTQVLGTLKQGLDIRFNTIIQSIQYDAHKVCLTDHNGQTYETAHVVITVPLGVLKQQSIEFHPALPVALQSMIQSMGFGSFNKVFFQLTQPLNFPQLPQTYCHFYLGQSRCYNILDLSHFYQQPTYLMLFGGKESSLIDHSNDQQVWQWLRWQIQGWQNLPEQMPNTLIISRWGNDPFSMGSFSFPAVGHRPELVQLFQQGVSNRLYFAGEHCSEKYAGTVHGAYLSGIAAAQRVLSHLD